MLWFFQQIAGYMGLIVTSWVVQGIVAVAALIIVVVFRNEIRTRAAGQELRRRILWGFTAKTRVAPVDIIADSAFELARRSHGAHHRHPRRGGHPGADPGRASPGTATSPGR
ncbi:MAG: hypothetical protein MZV70_56260 [Desulfobacterales bacterium]|nr:hypothetical protein [Desulfobacterales bacterium]